MRRAQIGSLCLLALCCVSFAVRADRANETSIAEGQAIAWDRNAGNCLSCHWMPEAELPGNIGPPLIQMRFRFQDRAELTRQVWDATMANPDTVMPPYGKHGILNEQQIEQVIDYLYSI